MLNSSNVAWDKKGEWAIVNGEKYIMSEMKITMLNFIVDHSPLMIHENTTYNH
jgi:hypothetical protein